MTNSVPLPATGRIQQLLGYADADTITEAVDGTVWFSANYIYPNGWRPGATLRRLPGGRPVDMNRPPTACHDGVLQPLPNARPWYVDFVATCIGWLLVATVVAAAAAFMVSWFLRSAASS